VIVFERIDEPAEVAEWDASRGFVVTLGREKPDQQRAHLLAFVDKDPGVPLRLSKHQRLGQRCSCARVVTGCRLSDGA
jgi:hypothetical protein